MKCRLPAPESEVGEGREAPNWYRQDFMSSGGCIQCPLGASPHLVIYLFKCGLVTCSILDTWVLGPLDSISYKASAGGLSGTVEGLRFYSQANKLASYSFMEAGSR